LTLPVHVFSWMCLEKWRSYTRFIAPSNRCLRQAPAASIQRAATQTLLMEALAIAPTTTSTANRT
ncbi:hypothetical protein GGF38_003577, partial [Coemansia sp. RSA 25]